MFSPIAMFVPCALLVLLAAVPAVVWADADVTGPDGLQELPGLDPEQEPRTGQLTREDLARFLKDKCLKNGGSENFNQTIDQIMLSVEDLRSCFRSAVSLKEADIEEAVLNGENFLVTLTRKVCPKVPVLVQCLRNFTSRYDPCLDESERELQHGVRNVTEGLVSFVCEKSGDRIVQFLNEGGVECVEQSLEGMKPCVDDLLSKYLPNGAESEKNQPSVNRSTEEQCQDTRKVQTCVVKKLRTCSSPTPANFLEEIFNFVYRETPCGNLPTAPRGLQSTTGSPFTIMFSRDENQAK